MSVLVCGFCKFSFSSSSSSFFFFFFRQSDRYQLVDHSVTIERSRLRFGQGKTNP
jgi:hypothetical protein